MQGGAGDLGTAGTAQSCIRHTKSTARFSAALSTAVLWGLLIPEHPKERTHRLSPGGSRTPSTHHKTPGSPSHRADRGEATGQTPKGSAAPPPGTPAQPSHRGVCLPGGSSTDPVLVGGSPHPGCGGRGPLLHILSLTEEEEGSPNPAFPFSLGARPAPQGPDAWLPSA